MVVGVRPSFVPDGRRWPRAVVWACGLGWVVSVEPFRAIGRSFNGTPGTIRLGRHKKAARDRLTDSSTVVNRVSKRPIDVGLSRRRTGSEFRRRAAPKFELFD